MNLFVVVGIALMLVSSLFSIATPAIASSGNPHENPKETTETTSEKRNGNDDTDAGQTETTTTVTEESCTNNGGNTPGGQEPDGGCKGGGMDFDEEIISEECTVSTRGNPDVRGQEC